MLLFPLLAIGRSLVFPVLFSLTQFRARRESEAAMGASERERGEAFGKGKKKRTEATAVTESFRLLR